MSSPGLVGVPPSTFARSVTLVITMGAFMDQGFLGRLLSLALKFTLVFVLNAGRPNAHALTMTLAPSDAPVVQTQVVGQAALEASLEGTDGAFLQLSDALSVQPRPQPVDGPLVGSLIKGLSALLWAIAAFWGLLTLRQWLLTFNRHSQPCRQPFAGLVDAPWPKVSVIVIAHNSQSLVREALQSLCATDYPVGQRQIVVINDRSTDRTRQIIEEEVLKHPGQWVSVHRSDGPTGRAACLLSAMPHVDGEFVLVLDARHWVAPGFLKQIMAPFFDPEVGSVTGRVMPLNMQANLLTRLTDLGWSALQQVEQQARSNLGLKPLAGPGVVAWRHRALVAACAASSDAMADDVDVAQRLSLRGWLQVHQGVLDGYVVVPQTWDGQAAQLAQAALMQHRAAARHGWSMLLSRHGAWPHKADALLTNLLVWMPALWVVAAACVLGLYGLGASGEAPWGLAFLTLAACASSQGGAPFFQGALGARLDGRAHAIRLLPLQWVVGLPGLLAQAAQTGKRIRPVFRTARATSGHSPVVAAGKGLFRRSANRQSSELEAA